MRADPIFRDPPRIGRDAEEVVDQEQGDEDVEWEQQAQTVTIVGWVVEEWDDDEDL